MDPESLINAMQLVDLSSRTRSAAIQELVAAGLWNDLGITAEEVIAAIEDREATAQTVIAPGLALPHAVMDWDGDFRILLGRSRKGVDYGTDHPVQLIVLLAVGRLDQHRHLEILSSVAQLFRDEALRGSLASARDLGRIKKLLLERAGTKLEPASEAAELSSRSLTVVENALRLAESLTAQALLLAVERADRVPWPLLEAWAGRLLIITTTGNDESASERPDTHLFEIPHESLSRMARANLGLLLAQANGLITPQGDVVCVTGRRGHPLDSITVTMPEDHLGEMFTRKTADKPRRRGVKISPAVILRMLSVAIELAAEGRESRSVGVLFVIGDTRNVLPLTQQLVLNPFHGFSRQLRNVMDPSLTETIKEFAQLDGAFLIQSDGTALSAGTYLVPKARVSNLPGGLGARHRVAAAITSETQAIAIVVSESTGTVTLFQDGKIILSLERATLTRW